MAGHRKQPKSGAETQTGALYLTDDTQAILH
jgi:hypothetical protein